MLVPFLSLLLSATGLHGASDVPTPSAAHRRDDAITTRAVELVGITVADLERSIDFYTRVLDFELESRAELAGGAFERLHGVFAMRARVAVLRLGEERLELSEYLAPRGAPIAADARSNDRSFQHAAIVVADMARAYARLREHRVRHASSGPQLLPAWNPAAGGIEAFYFHDPDAHVLELIRFPQGKGDPRWRAPSDRLFLGIDHTAIVVEDTEASLAFYRDRLGLHVAGTSENWGEEQERLNGVFGARLRITALRADHGPGLELLEYLAPTNGRPYPSGARACDLTHWHTRLRVDSALDAERLLRNDSDRWLSPGSIEVPERLLGFERALRASDPDGHVLEFVQRARP